MLVCKHLDSLPTHVVASCSSKLVHHQKCICILAGAQELLNHPIVVKFGKTCRNFEVIEVLVYSSEIC